MKDNREQNEEEREDVKRAECSNNFMRYRGE